MDNVCSNKLQKNLPQQFNVPPVLSAAKCGRNLKDQIWETELRTDLFVGNYHFNGLRLPFHGLGKGKLKYVYLIFASSNDYHKWF